MDKKYDVVALGELLIDFTTHGESEQGNPVFEANPGGAPCNVLAMLQRLGKRTAFIGKVGADMFGKMLKERAESTGIDLSGLVFDKDVRTTLAFVQNFADGDRDFSFYRNPGADMMLRAEEVNKELIQQARLFHFGTLSMTDPVVEEATRLAVDTAKQSGCLISFDPNLREPLWGSLDKAKEKIEYGMSQCDILKISDNEIAFLTGVDEKDGIDEGVQKLLEAYQIPIVFATLGKAGSRAYYKGMKVEVAGFVNPHTIETTGAGDTFCACALNYLLEHDIDQLTKEQLQELLTFANGAASLITTRKGALCVMPKREEVEQFISRK